MPKEKLQQSQEPAEVPGFQNRKLRRKAIQAGSSAVALLILRTEIGEVQGSGAASFELSYFETLAERWICA